MSGDHWVQNPHDESCARGLSVGTGRDYGNAVDIGYTFQGGRYGSMRVWKDTTRERLVAQLRDLANFIESDGEGFACAGSIIPNRGDSP